MSKVAVVYWSGTGNTEAMAYYVTEGAKATRAEVDVFTSAEFSADKTGGYPAIAFRRPFHGSGRLEESEFEPMFEEVKTKLGGKRIGLFGSYGWGDGEWMRIWEDDCDKLGARWRPDRYWPTERRTTLRQKSAGPLGSFGMMEM